MERTPPELGDAAMVNPRAKHATRHKFLLKRLVKTLRSAWGMLIEMEPTAHLSFTVTQNNLTWRRRTSAKGMRASLAT